MNLQYLVHSGDAVCSVLGDDERLVEPLLPQREVEHETSIDRVWVTHVDVPAVVPIYADHVDQIRLNQAIRVAMQSLTVLSLVESVGP
jgi:hypothetical protein